MNLFYSLFYHKYVEDLLFPLPVKYWQVFNESLTTFPIVELSSKYPASSRRTKKIQLLILHHTGSLDNAKALKWFINPNNYSSVHYLIDLDGNIQQLVSEENSAFHAPNTVYKHSRLVNESSIGISLVGDGYQRFTEAQYEGVAMLCAHLLKKYELQIEDIQKHSSIETVNSITPSTDPSPWDHKKFQSLLEQFIQI